MEPSDHLKKYGHDKLSRLEKYLDSLLTADVTFSVDKFRHKAEVVITSDGIKIKAVEETDDMYSSLDQVIDKLEKQIKRHMEKLKGHKPTTAKRASGTNGQDRDKDYDESEPDVVTADRTKELTLSQMNLAEAAEFLAHSNTPFVAFLDNDDKEGFSLLHQFNKDGLLELVKFHK
jgi:putative sigma-54 modulation protein